MSAIHLDPEKYQKLTLTNMLNQFNTFALRHRQKVYGILAYLSNRVRFFAFLSEIG